MNQTSAGTRRSTEYRIESLLRTAIFVTDRGSQERFEKTWQPDQAGRYATLGARATLHDLPKGMAPRLLGRIVDSWRNQGWLLDAGDTGAQANTPDGYRLTVDIDADSLVVAGSSPRVAVAAEPTTPQIA